jgi:hypothetical protein
MKTLIYGLQSSGASLFAYFLSQKPDTIGIIDLYHDRLAPTLDIESDIVLKCTINNRYHFNEHVEKFQPDLKILFIRDPIQNALRLSQKRWANWSGTVVEKLALAESYVANWRKYFDVLITHEEFMYRKIKVLPVDEFYNFPRSVSEIVEFSCTASDWCKNEWLKSWGIGDIHTNSISFIFKELPNICPKMYESHRDSAKRLMI